jgi:hypothetical protein
LCFRTCIDINYYYDPDLYYYNLEHIWYYVGNASAAEVKGSPSLVSGVELVFGFSSTVPWPSSVDLDDRYTGLCKHPYLPKRTFPQHVIWQPWQQLDENLN